MTAIATIQHGVANGDDVSAEAAATDVKARRGFIPAVCDVSVTNACNATCEFCCFAVDKQIIKEKRWIDSAEFARALPILHRRGFRYVNFQGGEPLLHPAIHTLVANSHAAGLRPALITNGWMLPRKIDSLIEAGLSTLLVSIDSHSMAAHERNRGLNGVGERIKTGLSIARQNGIPTIASVTVSRLVDYEELPKLLEELGFDAVDFSCPRRNPLGSSSMVYNPNSTLVDFKDEELLHALDEIKLLKKRFHVQNPTAMLDEVQRHIRGETERFACVGGYKYFYLDWNLNIWRCEAWGKPLGSVFDLDRIPDCRDRCNDCIMSCYRDASVLMHAGVAAEDARNALAAGHVGEATRTFFRRTVAQSIGAVLEQAPHLLRLAKKRPQHEIITRQE